MHTEREAVRVVPIGDLDLPARQEQADDAALLAGAFTGLHAESVAASLA